MSEAARAAASTYSEAFRQAQNGLTQAMRDVTAVAGGVVGWMDDRLRNL